ncbi:MAG: hypothetical protein WC884_01045 [Candidatus Paceibacterota bacterium]
MAVKNSQWTIEKIKEGFDRFFKEHDRLPKSLEIDKVDYLPNRKFIERNFGGLEKLRGDLGYLDTHFGKGKFRSEIAHRVNISGRNTELALEKLLKDKFGEVFVHTEKIFDNTKNRIDFYIYSPSGNFGIDVFGTETMHTLQTNMSAKLSKYSGFKERLFFVVANDSFSQIDLDSYSIRKKRILPMNAKIITVNSLEKFLLEMNTYFNPLNLK